MKSLFVLSLPRCMSSLTYHFARQALDLREPCWTSDGEILNNDRHVLFTGDAYESGLKYLRQRQAPWVFDQVSAFLDETVQRQGFIYKDVVNPFVVASWYGLEDLAVLRIRRPLADIAWSVFGKRWKYPAYALTRTLPADTEERETLILRGLLQAEQVLSSVPGETVDYDDLVSSEEVLRRALRKLYPHRAVAPVAYLDDGFRSVREAVLRRRDEPGYRALRDRLETLRTSRLETSRAA